MTQLEVPTMDTLLQELRTLIDETRFKVAAAVNASLTMLYWRIGKRINADVLQEERAAYGETLIVDLSHQLAEEYGRGFPGTRAAAQADSADEGPAGPDASRRPGLVVPPCRVGRGAWWQLLIRHVPVAFAAGDNDSLWKSP